MKRIGKCCKLKNAWQNRDKEFLLTLIITYILTIVFTLLIILNHLEDVMIKDDNLLAFFFNLNNKYEFGGCSNLDGITYLIARLVETLIPTTITFCAPAFVLKSVSGKSDCLRALLCVSLFMFCMVGMFFMVTKVAFLLKIYMHILAVLSVLSILFSWRINIQSNDGIHKNEISDGQICR